MHPTKPWVYVEDQFGNILKYDRNVASGQIAVSTSGTANNGAGLGQGFIEPTGYFAYLFRGLNVDQYSIDQTTGLMTFISSLATTDTPRGLAFDPSGRFAYLTVATVGGVGSTLAYAIQANGSLQLINGAPTATYPNAVLTSSVAVDPTGKYVYVTVGLEIYQYTIHSSGALISMAPSSITIPGQMGNILIDASGKYLYALTNNNTAIAHFAISAVNGSLTPIATGAGPYNLVTNAVLTGGSFASSMSGR
jgi:6-phosphogluconolactonase (cycloisomerase 2 family)